MGSRSTYVRRIEQLESAVIGFGRGVVRRRAGARTAHHRAIDVAVDALVGSPFAGRHDVVDALEALDLALDALEARDRVGLGRADRLIERILEGAERPLVRHGVASAPDARLRRIALHVLAIADAARTAVPAGRPSPPAPVA